MPCGAPGSVGTKLAWSRWFGRGKQRVARTRRQPGGRWGFRLTSAVPGRNVPYTPEPKPSSRLESIAGPSTATGRSCWTAFLRKRREPRPQPWHPAQRKAAPLRPALCCLLPLRSAGMVQPPRRGGSASGATGGLNEGRAQCVQLLLRQLVGSARAERRLRGPVYIEGTTPPRRTGACLARQPRRDVLVREPVAVDPTPKATGTACLIRTTRSMPVLPAARLLHGAILQRLAHKAKAHGRSNIVALGRTRGASVSRDARAADSVSHRIPAGPHPPPW